MESQIPRRANLELNTPAELAIRDAMFAVEDVGAHPLLTDAVNLLEQAKSKVADYVDASVREILHPAEPKSGHGHVTPNPDGSKARCGGPACCAVCAQELAAKLKRKGILERTSGKPGETIRHAFHDEVVQTRR